MTNSAPNLRTRRLLACLFIVVFLVAYIVIVTTIAQYLPANKWLQMAYYGLTGILWGLPLIPVLSWSENRKAQAKPNTHTNQSTKNES